MAAAFNASNKKSHDLYRDFYAVERTGEMSNFSVEELRVFDNAL
jgi:hypothetical protein